MLRRRPAHPAGFTLVELLVVIAIIAILMGLLLPAIQKVRVIGKRAQASNEISQLNTAAVNFQQDWKAMPPNAFCLPQCVPLSSGLGGPGNTGGNAALMDASFNFLQAKYGSSSARWPRAGVDYNAATGVITWDASWNTIFTYNTNSNANPVLQGNQVMTLFLAGPSLQGWAHDRPAGPSANATGKMYYLEVSLNKLSTASGIGASAFGYPSDAPAYMDPFGTPYIYFGSDKVGGKYSASFVATIPTIAGTTTVTPYAEANGKFLNEKGVQIISAGENGRKNTAPRGFGPGGVWSPTVSPGYANSSDVGGDDMANFNGGLMLGVK